VALVELDAGRAASLHLVVVAEADDGLQRLILEVEGEHLGSIPSPWLRRISHPNTMMPLEVCSIDRQFAVAMEEE
jgi:hypothetical protein